MTDILARLQDAQTRRDKSRTQIMIDANGYRGYFWPEWPATAKVEATEYHAAVEGALDALDSLIERYIQHERDVAFTTLVQYLWNQWAGEETKPTVSVLRQRAVDRFGEAVVGGIFDRVISRMNADLSENTQIKE